MGQEHSLTKRRCIRVAGDHSAVDKNNDRVGVGTETWRAVVLRSKKTLTWKLVVVVAAFHMVAYHT